MRGDTERDIGLSVGMVGGFYASYAVVMNGTLHALCYLYLLLLSLLFSLSFITPLRTSPARRDYAWALRRLLGIFVLGANQRMWCGAYGLPAPIRHSELLKLKLLTKRVGICLEQM